MSERAFDVTGALHDVFQTGTNKVKERLKDFESKPKKIEKVDTHHFSVYRTFLLCSQ